MHFDAKDAVKPSPTNVGEGIPKLSPQKRKASEAVPASDQNVTPKRRSSRVCINYICTHCIMCVCVLW